MKKRILCILLVLSMVMAVMPLTFITATAKTDDEVQLSGDSTELTQPTIPENVKQSAEEFYKSYSAQNGNWVSTSCKFIQNALTSLPVQGQYAKIGVWVGKQFFNMLMGSSDDDRTEEMLEAINQLNVQNQTTLLKLDQLTDIVKDQYQLNYINEYYNGDKTLYALTKIYMGELQNTDGETEEQVEASRRQLLTYDIPQKSSSDINSLSSLSSYDEMVLAFGEKLKSSIFLNDGSCNTIDLMNNYALRHFKWEHQGYEMRENYWSSLISLYVTSSNLMRASLEARIEVYETVNKDKQAKTLRETITALNKLNEDIQKLGNAASFTRLGDDIRHYQVKGHEVYLFTQTTKQLLPYKDAGTTSDFKPEKGQKTNKHWVPFYTYTDSSTDKVYEGLDSKYYKYIYDDYNPAGSSQIINLYDIFFSKEEGNLTPPAGIDYSGTVTFVSNDIKTEHRCKKYLGGQDNYWDVKCKLYEAYGKIKDEYRSIAYFMDTYYLHWDYIPDEYLDSFIMVIPAAMSNNEVNVGQGEILTEEFVPFTVTFDANGGSINIKSTKTDINGYIAELPTPSYTGYEFDGWYTAQNVKVTSDTQFTEDTTVYAKWISVNSSTEGIDGCSGNHANLKHTEAKAATTESEGNIEYWYCKDCGKYFSDKDGKNEIKLADTVIAKLTKSTSPQTGDNRHIALWLALLFFVSSGILIGANAYSKKKNID